MSYREMAARQCIWCHTWWTTTTPPADTTGHFCPCCIPKISYEMGADAA